MIQRWFRKFRNGEGSLKDEEYRGWPLEVVKDELKVLFETAPRTTIWNIAIKLNISHPTVLDRINQLKKQKKTLQMEAVWTECIVIECALGIVWAITMIHSSIALDFDQQITAQWYEYYEILQPFPTVGETPKKYHGGNLVVVNPSDPLQLPESKMNYDCLKVLPVNRWNVPQTTTIPLAWISRESSVLFQDNTWPHIAPPTLMKQK